jgi:transposase
LEREKSRRQKGSNNRDKMRRKVSIAHSQVARARRDYHHKQALALVRKNQVIHVEDLNIPRDGQKPPARTRHLRCGVGTVRANHRREG